MQVLTVNGALVTTRDLEAEKGVVHVVDRVLFPPTVGDLVQTLQVGTRNAADSKIYSSSQFSLDF